jgi:PAS domain S-box-containing protein
VEFTCLVMASGLSLTYEVALLGRGDVRVPAAGHRLWLLSSVGRLVGLVTVVGLAAAVLLVLCLPSRQPVLAPGHLGGPWLFPALLALICLGELTAVSLRQGDAVEELALYEPAVLGAALLLPPHQAIAGAVLGLVLASVIRRRPLMKAAFNVGTYTTAAATMIAIIFTVAGTPGAVTVGVFVGVVIGTAAFTALNLIFLSQILALVNGVPAAAFLREQARLSIFMAAGSVATGLTTVAIALREPLLLPVTAMPALAMTFAYRVAAQGADERARSTKLLRLSQVLATPQDALSRVLGLARGAFGADMATMVLDDGTVLIDTDGHREPGIELAARMLTIGSGAAQPRVLGRDELAADWGSGLVVPIDAGGRTFGSLALASRKGRDGLHSVDLALLAPIASALAAALTRAEDAERIIEETSKLQAVVEQSTDGILVLDGAGVVQLWSSAMTDLTGIGPEDAVGRAGTSLLADADSPAPVPLPVSPQCPTAVIEITLSRPDGERRRLRCAHSAVFSGAHMTRDVVLIHDLTLEHEIQRLKSDFIATVSHELRTPLTPIKGYVTLLRTRGDRMTEQKRQDCLNLIADRTDHLARLVEDLLLASRLDAAGAGPQLEVSLGTHDILDIIRQVVGDLADSRCHLRLPEEATPVLVACDPGRTVQVLTNLVGNALKYSPPESPVEVRLSVLTDQVDIAVTDIGAGIPAAHLDRIFEKFHRVQNPMTMTTGGSGIGLYIAKSLAQAMSGDVRVTSVLGHGSTFTLDLPRVGKPTHDLQDAARQMRAHS